MTAPLLRCAPLATPRGRCHGVNDEHLRRGAGSGSPLSFVAQESQTLAYDLRDRIAASAWRILERQPRDPKGKLAAGYFAALPLPGVTKEGAL